jgi:hypothetical protein
MELHMKLRRSAAPQSDFWSQSVAPSSVDILRQRAELYKKLEESQREPGMKNVLRMD